MRCSRTNSICGCIAVAAMLLTMPAAWGHGFEVSQNNYLTPPTALTVSSMQPVLDNALNPPGQGLPGPYATQGPSDIFTDEFASTPMVGNGGGVNVNVASNA